MTRIRFEDLPSTNTPRNAENLNKLNNVVISTNEPTTGEEVWFQRGKNIFNALGVSYGSPYNVSYVINNKNQLSITNNGDWAQLPVNINGLQPNSTYTITTKTTNNSNCPAGLFIDNSNYQLPTQSETVSVTTQTDGNGTLYFVLYSNWSGTPSTGTILYDEIQVEEGPTSTSFETYIDRKIYTKNDNGVYEEFYNDISGINEKGHFTQLADGTLIQRGKYTTPSIAPTSGYIQSVNLPINFIDNDYNVVTQKMSGGSGGFSQVIESSLVINNSIFDVTSWNNGGGNADPITIGWVAIGKWK